MSVKVMDQVWGVKMRPNEKLVLLAYADHAAHDGTSIFPAVASVAEKTGYSQREVQRVTRTLEKKGLLVSDGTGPRGTNRWRCPVKGDDLSAVTSEGVTSATAGDDVDDSGGMTPVSPEPSFNRPFNRQEYDDEDEGNKIKNVYTIFGEEIGLLTPLIADELDDACRAHGEHWLVEALKVASRNGKRNWAYAKGILAHWKADGYGSPKKSNSRSRSPAPAESRGEAVARAWLEKQES